jgi:glycosyltransferase involved in cell wall biosynthesis
MRPKVSIVVPARDEAEHIERCVRSIVDQEIDEGIELIVVDDGSRDETAILARSAGAIVLPSPRLGISAALNCGLAAAGGAVLIRFDAHAEMPPGYINACLRALEEEEGAANVGGWRVADGATAWGRAVGSALASPLGVGHPEILRPPAGGGCESEGRRSCPARLLLDLQAPRDRRLA